MEARNKVIQKEMTFWNDITVESHKERSREMHPRLLSSSFFWVIMPFLGEHNLKPQGLKHKGGGDLSPISDRGDSEAGGRIETDTNLHA